MDFLILGIFDCTMCWLKMLGLLLLAGFLGWLLHKWLFGKYKDMYAGAMADVDSWKGKYNGLEKDHASLKYKFDESEKDNAALRASLASCEADKAMCENEKAKMIAQAAASAGTVLAASSTVMPTETSGIVAGGGSDDSGAVTGYAAILGQDNLQIIEGVGPKISGLLADAGYSTWGAVAAASYDDLKKVLDDAGPRYRIHDPKTWPEQARLANEGKWDELIKYQKFLDTGRENTGDFETPSKVEKLYSKKLGFSASKPEDLKVVEGIGPKIEGLLKAAGIANWSDLAGTSVDRLKEILKEAGDRYRLADPGTWPKQASLAASASWKELKEYQDFLQGGK